MIKNKEDSIVSIIKNKIDNMTLNIRTVDDDGNITFNQVKMKDIITSDEQRSCIEIMKFDGTNPTQYTGSSVKYSNTFQNMYGMLVETIVKETIAIIIKDTEVSSLARLNKLEENFDNLVEALATVSQASGAIASYKTSNPKSDREQLKANEDTEGTDLK